MKCNNPPLLVYVYAPNLFHQANTNNIHLYQNQMTSPSHYQFYSLKDTGITDAIDRVGLTVAKDQARHSSVATTNRYVRKGQLKAHPELKDFEGNF